MTHGPTLREPGHGAPCSSHGVFRFARAPADSHDAHRPLQDGEDLSSSPGRGYTKIRDPLRTGLKREIGRTTVAFFENAPSRGGSLALPPSSVRLAKTYLLDRSGKPRWRAAATSPVAAQPPQSTRAPRCPSTAPPRIGAAQVATPQLRLLTP